jgi:hypothetical protein
MEVGSVSVGSWACAGENEKTMIASNMIPGVNFHCIPGFFVLGKLN